MAHPKTQKAIPNSYMARGWQPGTGEWVTIWGDSREEVEAKVWGRPHRLESVRYYGPVEGGVKE